MKKYVVVCGDSIEHRSDDEHAARKMAMISAQQWAHADKSGPAEIAVYKLVCVARSTVKATYEQKDEWTEVEP